MEKITHRQNLIRSILLLTISGSLFVGMGAYFARNYLILKIGPSRYADAVIVDIIETERNLLSHNINRKYYQPVFAFKSERGETIVAKSVGDKNRSPAVFVKGARFRVQYLISSPQIVLSESGQTTKLFMLVLWSGLGAFFFASCIPLAIKLRT